MALGGPTLYTCPSGNGSISWILQPFYFMLVVLPLSSSVCCHQSLLAFISISLLFLICYHILYTTIQVRAWGGYISLPFSRIKSMEIVSFAAKNMCSKKKKKEFTSYSFFFRNGSRKELSLFKFTYWQAGHWFNWHKHKPYYFSKDFCICYHVIP